MTAAATNMAKRRIKHCTSVTATVLCETAGRVPDPQAAVYSPIKRHSVAASSPRLPLSGAGLGDVPEPEGASHEGVHM